MTQIKGTQVQTPLAVEISDTLINWVVGILSVGLPAIGSALWLGWRKFIAFMSPKITGAFKAHTELVDTMKEQVPIVSDTLKKLGETQDRQCETLARHDQLHEQHADKLNKIWNKLSDGHEAR